MSSKDKLQAAIEEMRAKTQREREQRRGIKRLALKHAAATEEKALQVQQAQEKQEKAEEEEERMKTLRKKAAMYARLQAGKETTLQRDPVIQFAKKRAREQEEGEEEEEENEEEHERSTAFAPPSKFVAQVASEKMKKQERDEAIKALLEEAMRRAEA